MKKTLLILLIIVSFFTLVACKDDEEPVDTFTVSFVTNGGIAVDPITVEDGSSITLPANPTKDGYTFAGWYLESALTTPFVVSTLIDGNLTLYAKWEAVVVPVTYQITFNVNGGSAVASQTINQGSPVSEPTDPTKTGYNFAGWYTDALLQNAFVFTTVPTSNLTLYAKWMVIDTTDPIFFGISPITVNIGDAFDPMEGISAIDDVDGTITSLIQVTGTYDINVAGVYTLTYTVSDAAGNEIEATRQLVVREAPTSELYITNGDFNEPLEGTWTHWAGEGGASTVAIVDGVLEYNITANGGQWWSSQFSQPNLTVPQGKGFKLIFEAKADAPRAIVTKLENSQYVGYFDVAHMLTTEWVTYEVEFFVTAATITNGKLIFGGGTTVAYLPDGNALTKVYLDNIRFVELEPTPDDEAPVITGATDKMIDQNEIFDPLAGITVSDNMDVDLTVDDIVITGTVDSATPGEYVLTYTLEDASGNEAVVTRTITVADGLAPSTFVVLNGDFETEQLTPYPQPAEAGWGWHGAGVFSIMIQDGVAKIDVTNLGTVAWGVQFYQQNRIIEQGRIYRITFDAKADIARPIMVALEQGTSRRFDQIVDITTEWASYEVIIDHILPGYTNGKFAFFMGLVGSNSVPTVIYLDNIEIERIAEVVDTQAPVLRGVEDYIIRKGFDFNPLNNVTIFDAVDKDLTLDDITVTSNLDINTVGEYLITYVIEDASGNSATYNRAIHVKEAVDMPMNYFTVVNGDFSTDQATPYAQPAVDGWGWHGAGTFTVSIAEGFMTQVITAVGTVPHGTQFYQQNRIIDTQAMYLLTYRAKVDLERSIRLSLEAGTTVNWFEIVDLTTEWATYQTVITVPGGGFTNGKFAFFAGLVESDSPATTFYLDDIELELVGYLVDEQAPVIIGLTDVELEAGLDFEPTAGVSVYDVVDKALTVDDLVVNTSGLDIYEPGTYTVTYQLTDRSGNMVEATRTVVVIPGEGLPSTFKVINGDFETEQLTPMAQPATTGWGWHGSGSFNTFIKDGVATIEIFDTWTQFYGTQFYLQNREVRQGHTYRITFMAKADDARPLRMSLEPGASGFNAFFNLTDEWATYTYEYTHTAATITNGKFAFFAGNMHGFSTSTTIYLDNIVVERIEALSADTEAPQIWNALDTVWTVGHAFDPLYGIQVYDHVDTTLLLENLVVTGTVDVNTIGDYQLTYSITDAQGNEANVVRTISVVAEVDMLDSRIVFVDPDFEAQAPITNLDANVGWTLKISGTGAFNPHTFVDGAIAIEVTNVGTVPHGIQFFQRNGFVAELGQTYLLSFKAKADVARDIRVNFEETSFWANLDYEIVSITTEWVTYNVYITNMVRSHADVKIAFFLGLIDAEHPENSALTTVYFDDVELTLVGYAKDEVAPMIGADAATVEQNAVWTPMTGVKYGDFAKKPDVVISSETPGLVTLVEGAYTINTAVVGSYVLTYTVTDFYGNVTVFNRDLVITEPQAE